MLQSLGTFTPFGEKHIAKYPHLVDHQPSSREIDFSTLFASKSQSTPKTRYTLYAADDRPSKLIDDLIDERHPANSARDLSAEKIPNGAIALEEELYVSESTVIWSQGGHIVKSFKFELENQAVELALFAWFPFECTQSNDGPFSQKYSTLDQWEEEDLDETIFKEDSVMHPSFSILSTGRKRKHSSTLDSSTKRDKLNETKKNDIVLRKAVCIILRDTCKIYFSDGAGYSVHLPFPIQRACALDIGIIMERRQDYENTIGLITPSARFISITNPIQETKAVNLGDDSRQLDHSFSQDILPSDKIDQGHQLVFATTVKDGADRRQLVVTFEPNIDAHYVWLYTDTTKEQPHGLRTITGKRKAVGKQTGNTLQKKAANQSMDLNLSQSTHGTPQPLTRKDSLAQFHEDFCSDTDQLFGSEADDSFQEKMDQSGLFLFELYREPTRELVSKKETPHQSRVFVAHDLDGAEILYIMNKRHNTLTGLSVARLLARASPTVLRLQAKAAVAVTTRLGYKDVLVVHDNRLQIVVDPKTNALVPVISTGQLPRSRLMDLRDSVADRFNIVFSNNQVIRHRVECNPQSGLVLDCIAALSVALPPDKFGVFRKRFIKRCFDDLQHGQRPRSDLEWTSFIITLLSFFPITAPKKPLDMDDTRRSRQLGDDIWQLKLQPRTPRTVDNRQTNRELFQVVTKAAEHNRRAPDSESLLDYAESIVYCLHIQYEDYHLCKLKQRMGREVGHLLIILCTLLDKQRSLAYYASHGLEFKPDANILSLRVPAEVQDNDPIDMIVFLRYFGTHLKRYTSLDDIPPLSGINPTLGIGRNYYAYNIRMALELYESRESGRQQMLLCMLRNAYDWTNIRCLQDIIGKPLIDTLEDARLNPDMDWDSDTYRLIGRNDIAKQLDFSKAPMDPNAPKFRLYSPQPFQCSNMHDIMSKATETSTIKPVDNSDTLNVETERLRFGYTGIVEGVRNALDVTRVPELTVPERPDLGDVELSIEHQNHATNMAYRTMAISVGRGMYAFGTFIADVTKTYPIETLNLSVKLLPLRTVVNADDRIWSDDFLDWPGFHCGVAAGLRLSPSQVVSGSWIAYCQPNHGVTAQDGGFLFAQGLNGNLKKLPLINWYRSLIQKCELVTIGFVLGISVAYRGTKDTKVTKLLSVHIPALLPPDSVPFEQSAVKQATYMLGMGLIYMGSCDRLMSATLLKEIARNAYTNPSTLDANFESCSLAAGFGLGLITLGDGGKAVGLKDLRLVEKLYQLMTGQPFEPFKAQQGSRIGNSSAGASHSNPNRNNSNEIPRSKPINLDATSPGATIALGLMYLKTENSKVAELLSAPDTRSSLNYVRPDFLLLRTVAKNLIMWSTIQPSEAWIEQQLPEFMRADYMGEDDIPAWETEAIKQATYNVVSGACLCIGLRYAGTNNKNAIACLLSRLDFFMKQASITPIAFQEHVTRSMARACIDVVVTAAAMVAAGSGNCDVYERVKILRNRVDNVTKYGSHMATHMAMGLLFVGLGGYTLKTTNEAIASLLCAFYPFYPNAPDDNRYHLQAFRHLWVLALDVRWLTPFDVDTKKPCRVPLTLTVYEDQPWIRHRNRGSHTVRVIAPTVVPTYSLIKSISVESPLHMPFCMGMEDERYRKSITDGGILYVKRKDAQF